MQWHCSIKNALSVLGCKIFGVALKVSSAGRNLLQNKRLCGWLVGSLKDTRRKSYFSLKRMLCPNAGGGGGECCLFPAVVVIKSMAGQLQQKWESYTTWTEHHKHLPMRRPTGNLRPFLWRELRQGLITSPGWPWTQGPPISASTAAIKSIKYHRRLYKSIMVVYTYNHS